MRFELFPHPHDGLKDAKGEFRANHRSHLHNPFETVLNAIHPGRDDPLDGVWNLNLRGLPAQHILIILPLDGTIFQ